jgi:aminoglycoside 2'-N-acetyltransferase I
VIRAGFELGALSDGTGIDGFYGRRGWIPWAGTTWVAAPGGLERTAEDDGGVYVLCTPTTPELDVDGNLVCDWRLGDVW